MITTDAFGVWSTRVLVGVATRVTPLRELDRWVTTADNREWRIREGRAYATNGTRDETGAPAIVMEVPEEDLREFIVEQLEHYGITLADVNRMKS